MKYNIRRLEMETVLCGGGVYYLENGLKEFDKAYFYGCSRSRSMIKKKDIPETEYVFAHFDKKTGIWEISNQEYKRSVVLVSKTWADYNVPRLRPPIPPSAPVSDSKVIQERSKAVALAPPIIELEDHEKFRDKDGNILEIEVRGERHYKKCYFLVKDISCAFSIPSLQTTISKEHTSYSLETDYQYFIRPNIDNVHVMTNKKMLFLTYEGLIKTLYVSRSPFACHFREWATERLFTIQMGDQEDRDTLAGDMIGVSAKTIHEVFRKNTEKTPCIYLFRVCEAKRMFPEDDSTEIICKYGYTDDLPRRTREHQAFFQKERRLGPVQLLCFAIIDPRFLSDAENHVARVFRHNKVSYENQAELVRLDPRLLKDIRADFGLIQKSYLGSYTELVEKIHQMEKDHQKEMFDHKLLYHQEKARADLLEKEVELKTKELENEVLRRKLIEMRIQINA